jgi:hypothetical protein
MIMVEQLMVSTISPWQLMSLQMMMMMMMSLFRYLVDRQFV